MSSSKQLMSSPSAVKDGADDGVFARLVPMSPLARLAFSDLAQQLHVEPDFAPHARKFISYKEVEQSDFQEDPPSSPCSPHESTKVRWEGYWSLDFAHPPARSGLGWVAGSSREGLANNEVDLLLTPSPRAYDVASRHFRLTLNRTSGVLLVAADSSRSMVLINGTEKLMANTRSIVQTTGIAAGDCVYAVELTQADLVKHLAKVAKFFDMPAPVGKLSILTPTPQSSPTRQGPYNVWPASTGGSFGQVSYGVECTTGDHIAAKRLLRNRRNYNEIAKEIAMLRSLDHPNICTLKDVHYAAGDRPQTEFSQDYCDILYLFLSPLASTTLSQCIDAPLSEDDHRQILLQTSSAVAWLHSHRILHRDIKPANITISMQPHVLTHLIDFGHAMNGTESTNHMAGTVPYLAPEIIALKMGTAQTAYRRSADVWALGISLAEVFTAQRVVKRWSMVTNMNWQWMVGMVKAHLMPQKLVRECLLGMIQWEAGQRWDAKVVERRVEREVERLGEGKKGEPKGLGGRKREGGEDGRDGEEKKQVPQKK